MLCVVCVFGVMLVCVCGVWVQKLTPAKVEVCLMILPEGVGHLRSSIPTSLKKVIVEENNSFVATRMKQSIPSPRILKTNNLYMSGYSVSSVPRAQEHSLLP